MTGLLSRLSIALIQATAGWSPAARTRLGRWLGGLLWTLARARRRIALTNLQLCFPEKSAEERHALARACFDNLARGLIDHGVLACAALPAVERFIRIEGQEYLRAVHGKPLILVAPHFVGLDAGAVRLSIIGRGASIYARQRNAQWDRWLRLIRTRFSPTEMIAREGFDLRAAVRVIKRGIPFYYLPDQDYGPQSSIFVPFFGHPAATIPMVARLARLTGAQVMMVVTEMTADGYVLHAEPPWHNFPSDSVEADTERMNREIERWVRRLPAQYLWTHKRFKTRPPGAAPVY